MKLTAARFEWVTNMDDSSVREILTQHPGEQPYHQTHRVAALLRIVADALDASAEACRQEILTGHRIVDGFLSDQESDA